MRKYISEAVGFFKKDHRKKYIVEFIFLIALFILLLFLAASDVVSNVYGVVVGFALPAIVLYLLKLLGGLLEDLLKINYDTEKLLKIYRGDPNYKKKLQFKNTSKYFAYADVLVNRKNSFRWESATVEDNPGKFMQLDDFIVENYAQIFSAHSNSTKKNFDTVRLDKFDAATNTFYLSRSTYYNHLVTNRAVDFLLFDDVSLRTIYEYGPRISTLEESKMSNHIGINALVFLSDGRLLVPRRKGDSTISKNKITSSIAVMLDFPEEFKQNPREAKITKEYLFRDNIFKNLSERTKLPLRAIDKSQTEIEFLGFGQNIYEGGKPQFYFSVKLKNIDTKKYFEYREEYIREEKKSQDKSRIDVDKYMYVADYNSYTFEGDKIILTSYNQEEKPLKVKVRYEMSYLCNLWHYIEANK